MAYSSAPYAGAPYGAPVDRATAAPPTGGTLAGTLPALGATVVGTTTAPAVTGAVAGILSPLAAHLDATTDASTSAPATGTLAGVLPALTASLVTSNAITSTDTSWGNDGYGYGGTADVTYTAPVAAAPPGLERRDVRRVHQSLPTPTLVKGRPQ